MVTVAERAYNTAFPTADELWERSNADMTTDVPRFPIEIAANGARQIGEIQPICQKDWIRRRKIGSHVMLAYTMTDGIDRLVSVRIPDDAHRSDADMLTATSTAWTTTVGGYVGRRDERIFREIGLPTVSIGAEGSTNERLLTSAQLGSISLAKAAQSEQAILADISERFDLPVRQYGMGDSRGAMIKPGHTLYAGDYGNEVLFTDIKAPCVPDRLELKDVPKVGLWLGVETLGATAVAASLLANRDLGLLLGTFDAHPRALPTSLAGIMPALMSGEAGRLAQMAPDDMRGHVVLYGLDILSSVNRWHDIYGPKYDVALKNVPRGSHAHLLSRIDLQIDRIKRADDSMRTDNTVDANYVVRGHKPDYKKQAALRLVANQ